MVPAVHPEGSDTSPQGGMGGASSHRRRGPAEGPARMTKLREMQLVADHQAGDPGAMTALLTSYQRRIYSICYRMLNDADIAADLTQDSLVRVIEGLHGYDRRAAVSTWIIRITINCCLSYLRKQRLRRHGSLDDPVGPLGEPRWAGQAAKGELSAGEGVELGEMRAVLVKALERLEPDMRAVLVLRDLQDLDYQQIGDVLGVRIGTVKSRLFRARAALRDEAEARLAGGRTDDQTENRETARGNRGKQ